MSTTASFMRALIKPLASRSALRRDTGERETKLEDKG